MTESVLARQIWDHGAEAARNLNLRPPQTSAAQREHGTSADRGSELLNPCGNVHVLGWHPALLNVLLDSTHLARCRHFSRRRERADFRHATVRE